MTETYTPEGYQGLKEPIEIVINEDGSVQIDGEEVADVLVAGEKKQPDYTRCDQSGEKFHCRKQVGSGRLGIYLLAFSSIAIAGIYLYLQRLERRE